MSIIPNFRRGSIFDPFSLDLWEPLKDFPFPSSSSLSTFPEFSRENSAFLNTRIDWKETPEAHVFKADLPGLKKEEVKVEVEDNRVLQISGERNVEKEDKNDKWHRVERSSGKFLRRFQLPTEISDETRILFSTFLPILPFLSSAFLVCLRQITLNTHTLGEERRVPLGCPASPNPPKSLKHNKTSQVALHVAINAASKLAGLIGSLSCCIWLVMAIATVAQTTDDSNAPYG